MTLPAVCEIGCYVLHLYCVRAIAIESRNLCVRGNVEHPHFLDTPDEFTGRNQQEARRAARRAGWKRHGGDWICPDCPKP